MKLKLTSKELRNIGFEEGPSISLAMQLMERNFKHSTVEDALQLLREVLQKPEAFLSHEILQPLAVQLSPVVEEAEIQVRDAPIPYALYGKEFIDGSAIRQMEHALRLPISVAGALMPDAHHGYGLPIGGVLATRNAIIPYGVGVDIGCRMALTIFDTPVEHFEKNQEVYHKHLMQQTLFGSGSGFRGKYKSEHEILDSPTFEDSSLLQHLKDKAAAQLGSSGSGNHFVEFGTLHITDEKNNLGLPIGTFLALLTHSGSRGLGATIAGHFTQLAKEICNLPKDLRNLAYLDLQSEEGNDYWNAMTLAGNYASACHEIIHQKITKAIGAQVVKKIENHHNFAWKEIHNGEELIVHRKGATPAGKGVLGIIPGSMTAPGFIVSGTGVAASLDSASHGAGRKMSRTLAKNSITKHAMLAELAQHNVTLIGGGIDEAPMAYKNINDVMASQQDLVHIEARFQPRLVRMCDSE